MAQFELSPRRLMQMEQGLAALEASPIGAHAFAFFSPDEVASLIKAAQKLPYRRAKSSAGNNVSQDFDICFPAPRERQFDACADLLERAFAHCLDQQPDLFDAAIELNDFAVQLYPKGSTGIGIHRDAKRYRNIVCVITLAGESDFFISADRDGQGRVDIDDSPGNLLLLAAPGFRGLADPALRPLHGVDNIAAGRLSIGFRMG